MKPMQLVNTADLPGEVALSIWTREREWRSFTDSSPSVWRFADNGHIDHSQLPLVLLPGALGDASSVWRIAQAFDPERRVIAVTYPGGCDAQALADGLATLLQSLCVSSCAVWGSSYGGWWAQSFAYRHPSVIEALWLGNSFVDGSDVADLALFDADWLDTATSADVIARWDAALCARPDDELRAIQLHLLRHTVPPSQLHGRLRQVARAPALPATTVSRTVVSDCDDDPIIRPEVRARVRARYPNAQLVPLSIGGHYPHIVAARQLIEAMRSWLASA